MAAVSEAAGVLWDVLAPGAPRAELLTPEEAAAELRVSESAVTKLCGSGQIKASRVGKLWRVSRAELEKLKARR
jgi:excisionase family DNA binding protein